MKHISLFSGIGGFDLAAEWAGWTNVASCEINPFGRRVLSHYWPEAYHHDDIKTLTGEIIDHEAQKIYGPNWRADGVILSGGFPCQPYSLAGKRLGKEDERHLWPEMCRIIREIKPDWIVGENVFGIINWSHGLVFDEVQTDLETAGYEVQAFVLPACAADAPHRRDRVWIVAKSIKNTMRCGCLRGQPKQEGAKDGQQWNIGTGNCNGLCLSEGIVTNTNRERHEKCNTATESIQPERQHSKANFERGQRDWRDFPTESPIRNVYDGISEIMERHIKPEIYATIKKTNTAEDLQKVWTCFQSEDVQRKIGGLYKIHEPSLLLKTMQLCSAANKDERGISVFSEEASKDLLRKLSKYGTFANTPHGRELEKQFTEQFANTLPKLSHEIALVTMEAERASRKFAAWHRNESIKAAGNAIVPQIAYRIFETINIFTQHNTHGTQFEQTNARARK